MSPRSEDWAPKKSGDQRKFNSSWIAKNCSAILTPFFFNPLIQIR
mgnify:CR=1 FL=1